MYAGTSLVALVCPSHTPRWFAGCVLAAHTPLIGCVLAAHNQSEARLLRRQRSQTLHVESDQTPSTRSHKFPTQLNTPNRVVPKLNGVSPNVSDGQQCVRRLTHHLPDQAAFSTYCPQTNKSTSLLVSVFPRLCSILKLKSC